MQKITHKYTDYDGTEVVEDLYFNLRRDELAKNLHLKDQFEEFKVNVIDGERREMTSEETRTMFVLIEELLRLTYGVRAGEDNRRFKKAHEHPEVWENFYEAAVYDSFIFWLFEDTKRANDFMEALMPAQLREDAAKLKEAQDRGEALPVAPPEGEVVSEEKTNGGAKPKRKEPTHEELLQMFREKEAQRTLDPNTED